MYCIGGFAITAFWSNFRHAEVNRLAASVFSPRLLVNRSHACAGPDSPVELNDAIFHWLQQLDEDPAPLQKYLGDSTNRTSPRLGLYHEALWQFFFSHAPGYRLLAHNLPVRDNKKTLGEFDLIVFESERNRTLLLEVACKFYLQVANGASLLWIGPGQKDRLDIKARRVFEHQLTLHQHQASLRVLESLNLNRQALVPMASVCGTLFYPADYCAKDTLNLPAGQINPEHCRARYFLFNDWIEHSVDWQQQKFCVLKKVDWLAPLRSCENRQCLSASELAEQLLTHFENSTMPQMVARFHCEANGDERELERFFICDNDWYRRALTTIDR